VYNIRHGAVCFAFCSQYDANNHGIRQVEDEYVVEDQSEDGSRTHRQQSTTSIDRYRL